MASHTEEAKTLCIEFVRGFDESPRHKIYLPFSVKTFAI